MHRECRERFPCHRFQRKPVVSDPGMHHGTCVTHVPWYMSGSLTRGDGENVPGIPGACTTRNFTYLVRSPWKILYMQLVKYKPITILFHTALIDRKIFTIYGCFFNKLKYFWISICIMCRCIHYSRTYSHHIEIKSRSCLQFVFFYKFVTCALDFMNNGYARTHHYAH